MTILILFQQAHFLYKIRSNVLPLKHEVLGGNENLCTKKVFYDQVFITMIHIMKIYTTNHFHYHQLISLTKRAVNAKALSCWACAIIGP